jgi:PAS domain S-box-containing protein
MECLGCRFGAPILLAFSGSGEAAPFFLWLHAVSDLLIGLAYFSIPVALALLLRKRRDLMLSGIFWMFAGFLLACGTAHFFSLAALWAPLYRVEGWVKLLTALLSVLTALALWRSLPQILALPNPAMAEEGRREAEALFRTLAEGLPSLAWVRRNNGSYEYLNPQWHAYTGWTEADLAQRGHAELIHPDDLPAMIELYFTGIEKGEGHVTEFRHRRHDGAWRWTDSRVAPVRDARGNVVRWVGTLTDIHDQREERQRLLENERAARNEAEEASRLKDEFLAIVSHELRTPLSAILGWSQLLLSPKIAETELQKGLETIRRNARSQAQIIDDLLDMSRIITGKIRLDIQTVDLPMILEKALDSVRPAAAAKGVRIEVMIPPSCPVQGDPGRLQQVFWNLFSNAIRFTPKDGKMGVALECTGAHLEVAVSDTGEGIEPDFLPYVFDRFRQQDGSTSRAHGGLGLGLSIVKNLVELHGGEIRARSPGQGKGSTFTLHFPVSPADPVAVPEGELPGSALPWEEPGDPSLDGLKVLVVDDELDTREILQRLLKSSAAQVLLAASAREALALLRREKPHVLISDIGMPNEDGYWLIQQVRSLDPEQGGAVPAVALTALARAEDRIRALRAGFQAHTPKPVETTELLYIVAGLAGRTARRPRREAEG